MVMSPGQMLLTHFYYFCWICWPDVIVPTHLILYLLVHDVKETYGYQGVTSLLLGYSFNTVYYLLFNFNSGVYRYKCGRVDCEDEFIGESGRIFAERFKEHMKSPSPIYDHFNTAGHEVSLDNFSIVGREDHSMTRTIREAMLIRVNDHPWIEILASTNCHIYGMRCWSSHQN